MLPLEKPAMSKEDYLKAKDDFMKKFKLKFHDEELSRKVERTLNLEPGLVDTGMGEKRINRYRETIKKGDDVEGIAKIYINCDRKRKEEQEHPKVPPQKSPEEIAAENAQRWENHLAFEDR